MLGGCGNGNGNGDIYDYQAEVPETKTWPAAGVSKMVVSTLNGTIAVAVTGADPSALGGRGSFTSVTV